MSKMEREIMDELGWKGEGLIRLAERDSYESSDSNSEDLDMNNGFRVVNQQQQQQQLEKDKSEITNHPEDIDINKTLTNDVNLDIDNKESSLSSSSNMTSTTRSIIITDIDKAIHKTSVNAQLKPHQNTSFDKIVIKQQKNNINTEVSISESDLNEEANEEIDIKLEIPDIKLITIDMDGTLLDSGNRIGNKTRDAIIAAKEKGVEVVLATGKARPGAISACKNFGLYGDRGLISNDSAGIFLQGLVVYNFRGEMLGGGPILPENIVKEIFDYSLKNEIACTAFFGDTCGTLKMMPRVMELHKK